MKEEKKNKIRITSQSLQDDWLITKIVTDCSYPCIIHFQVELQLLSYRVVVSFSVNCLWDLAIALANC